MYNCTPPAGFFVQTYAWRKSMTFPIEGLSATSENIITSKYIWTTKPTWWNNLVRVNVWPCELGSKIASISDILKSNIMFARHSSCHFSYSIGWAKCNRKLCQCFGWGIFSNLPAYMYTYMYTGAIHRLYKRPFCTNWAPQMGVIDHGPIHFQKWHTLT